MTNHSNVLGKKPNKFLPSYKFLTLIFALSFTSFTIANSIIAIINDDVITLDVIAAQIKPSSTKAQKIALVNRQIDLVLQQKQIEKIGIYPKPKMVDVMIDRIALRNKLTREQLQNSPEFDTIVENITKNLELRALKQLVLQRIEVNLTQAEIDAAVAKNHAQNSNFGKQIKIAQILITSMDTKKIKILTQPKDALIKHFLIKLTKQINNGNSFAALAKLHSQDPSYKNGGESGWLNPNKFSDIVRQQLIKLKVGEISKPFVSKEGWRIIKITQERDDKENQLKDIKLQLIQSQKDDYFKGWVKRLRKNTYIEIFDHKL